MSFLKFYRSSFGINISAIALVVLLPGISLAEVNSDIALKNSSHEINQGPATQTTQPDRFTDGYIRGYFIDTGRMLASPKNWGRSDWLNTGLIIGTTTLLYFADNDIKNLSQRNQSATGDKLAAVGNSLGNPFYTLPPLGLFYLYGNLYEDAKARRASLLAVESLSISSALTWTVKMATQRPRPFSGEASTTWDGPSFKASSPAFPSGHTTVAFSIASVFAEEYGNNPYVAPIVYGFATLTGLSRIYDNKHWATDAFFGAAIGYFVGKTVVSYHTVQSHSAFKIIPTISQQSFGLRAEYPF